MPLTMFCLEIASFQERIRSKSRNGSWRLSREHLLLYLLFSRVSRGFGSLIDKDNIELQESYFRNIYFIFHDVCLMQAKIIKWYLKHHIIKAPPCLF